MTIPTSSVVPWEATAPPTNLDDLPRLYEDDEEDDLGETNPHVLTEEIFRNGVKAHLAGQPQYRVFSNMNLYYLPGDPRPYVSPDAMIVVPQVDQGVDVTSYRIGQDGPAPVLTAEVLSERTHQQRDQTDKVIVYARLGVPEYILIDVTGTFLPERLLLKRLQPDGTWKDEQDADGGVTSHFGFRLIIDSDGQLRVLETATGKRYPRPDEAYAESEARKHAEERVRELEAELARLRQQIDKGQQP